MKRITATLISLALVAMSCTLGFAACSNFVASKDSNKYHAIDCRYAKNIKPENQICFNTQEEATKAGYVPCPVCRPDEKIKVVGSKDSDKYHLPTCPLVKNIKPENLVEYSSPAEAVKAGKKPCGMCKPPLPRPVNASTAEGIAASAPKATK